MKKMFFLVQSPIPTWATARSQPPKFEERPVVTFWYTLFFSKQYPPQFFKSFFIKLISVSIAVIIIVNLLFNIFLAERLEKFDRIFSIGRSDIRHEVKEKIRNELSDSLNKENILYEEDKILLYKLYQKLIREFQDLDKSKL